MRGKARCLCREGRGGRITPACAGKSLSDLYYYASERDHPRVCGEKDHRARARTTRIGSPPRVRGKVAYLLEDNSRDGITPACAGKSWGCLRWRLVSKDHPRVCGEKHTGYERNRNRIGSPPRVRGKDCDGGLCRRAVRITPACAGKSGVKGLLGINSPDHPRVCGEKRASWTSSRAAIGSPPRVRGKGRKTIPQRHSARITPACAGKSIHSRLFATTIKDHPRVCGEKLVLWLQDVFF